MHILEEICVTCRKRRRCREEPDMQRETFFAMGKGKPTPECREYEPRYSRGVEGVFDRTPRHSLSHY